MNGLVKIQAMTTIKGGTFAVDLTGELYGFVTPDLATKAKIGSYAWFTEQEQNKSWKRNENNAVVNINGQVIQPPYADNGGILVDIAPIMRKRITTVFADKVEAYKAKNQSIIMAAEEKQVMRKAIAELGSEFELDSEEIDDLMSRLNLAPAKAVATV